MSRTGVDVLAQVAELLTARKAELRALAERTYSEFGVAQPFAERGAELVDALIAALRDGEAELYAHGLACGERNAGFIRTQGVRLSEIAPALHRARIEAFFVRLPEQLPAELRTVALRHVAQFFSGYTGRLHSGDVAADYARLGLMVRRIATSRSADELARVAVDAARQVLALDAAWIGRRDDGTWRIGASSGLVVAPESIVVPDAAIAGIEVLLSGETLVIENVEDTVEAGRPPGAVLGLGSSLSVPIVVDGECRGLLGIGRRQPSHFPLQERAIADILGAQIAARMRELHAAERVRQSLSALHESERRLREQLRRKEQIVDALQQAFVPRALPTAPGVAFDAVYRPAEDDARVGGDWYDAFALPDGRIVFSVGDVAGHGLDAAVRMALLRQGILAAALDAGDPALVLERVNRMLLVQKGGLATAIVGFVEPSTCEVVYASAGHPPPILAGAGRAAFLPYGGMPLGIQPELELAVTRVPWTGPSAIVLYTDGLVEFSRDIAAAERRLLDVTLAVGAERDDDPASSIVARTLAGSRTEDDMAVLVLRLEPQRGRAVVSGSQTGTVLGSWDFDAREPAAAPLVRRRVVRFLARVARSEDDPSNAELVLGELLANVVEHAPGPVHVEVDWRDRAPLLTVRDAGPGFHERRRRLSPPTSESGRGLYLISQLGQDLNVRKRLEGGMELTVLLPLDRVVDD